MENPNSQHKILQTGWSSIKYVSEIHLFFQLVILMTWLAFKITKICSHSKNYCYFRLNRKCSLKINLSGVRGYRYISLFLRFLLFVNLVYLYSIHIYLYHTSRTSVFFSYLHYYFTSTICQSVLSLIRKFLILIFCICIS